MGWADKLLDMGKKALEDGAKNLANKGLEELKGKAQDEAKQRLGGALEGGEKLKKEAQELSDRGVQGYAADKATGYAGDKAREGAATVKDMAAEALDKYTGGAVGAIMGGMDQMQKYKDQAQGMAGQVDGLKNQAQGYAGQAQGAMDKYMDEGGGIKNPFGEGGCSGQFKAACAAMAPLGGPQTPALDPGQMQQQMMQKARESVAPPPPGMGQ